MLHGRGPLKLPPHAPLWRHAAQLPAQHCWHCILPHGDSIAATSPKSPHLGLRSTRITESPRRNILEMYRSLFTGLAFFAPFPAFGTSVHISFTFSRTMLQWRSNALIRPSSFLLLRTLM